MTYTLILGSSAITRDADHATIPADPGNVDWQAYLAWLAAGGIPTSAPPPVPDTSAAPIQLVLVNTLTVDANGDVTNIDALTQPSPGILAAWENAPGDMTLFIYPALASSNYMPRIEAPGFSASYDPSTKSGSNLEVLFTSIATGLQARPVGNFTVSIYQ